MGFFRRIARWMAGRYGNDQLNIFLYIVGGSFFLISTVLRWFTIWGTYIYIASVCFWGLSVLRALSRNIRARERENEIFLKVKYKLGKFFRRIKAFFKGERRKRPDVIDYESTFRIFECPTCKQKIRIPKGKGRIAITCPKCRCEFVRKT